MHDNEIEQLMAVGRMSQDQGAKATARPSRPKAPIKLVTAIGNSNDKVAQATIIFEDADGHRWQTDHLPAFLFDLEFVQ